MAPRRGAPQPAAEPADTVAKIIVAQKEKAPEWYHLANALETKRTELEACASSKLAGSIVFGAITKLASSHGDLFKERLPSQKRTLARLIEHEHQMRCKIARIKKLAVPDESKPICWVCHLHYAAMEGVSVACLATKVCSTACSRAALALNGNSMRMTAYGIVFNTSESTSAPVHATAMPSTSMAPSDELGDADDPAPSQTATREHSAPDAAPCHHAGVTQLADSLLLAYAHRIGLKVGDS